MTTSTLLRRLRLASQALFLGLFLVLLFLTAFRGSFQLAGGEVRLPWPVGLFLEIDPFNALLTALATGSLYRHLLWSLVVLIPTFFLGRFFCGWVCPFGTLHHFVGGLKSERKRGVKLIESNRYKKWQATKYYVMGAALVAALAGTAIGGLLDPISLLVRSMTLAVLPATSYGMNALVDALYSTSWRPIQLAADGLALVADGSLMSSDQPHFRQAILVGLIFVGLLGLNLRVTRFWCRALCPLGALLGLASRWSSVQLVKHHDRCDDCRRCLLHCQGGDDPIPGVPWRKAECHLCMNCVGECPTSGLNFSIGLPGPETAAAPELKRRRLVAGLVTGAALVPLVRATPALVGEPDSRLIRPPGALDEPHFLERCIRCGECMKVCPNNALHPTLAEGGLEALWSPVLVPRIGYCEPSCVLCSQVCPTGAIWEITQAQKLGKPEAGPSQGQTAAANGPGSNGQKNGADVSPGPIRIGTAFYDRGRCLPWAMATECIVCEEWCPTSPKAIYLLPAEAQDSAKNVKAVRQPYVDPKLCIGCGACEYACPVRDRPAVYVTSVGETRSTTNQFILQRAPRRVS